DSAAQKLGRTERDAGRAAHDAHGATLTARLEVAVSGHLVHDLRDIEGYARRRRGAALQPCEREQLTDQLIEALGLLLDAIQLCRGLRRRVPAREADGKAQARER